MRLQIKNFAKIKEADITLDGITVIAGENNTGKSTVGKILNSYFKAFKEYPIQINSQRDRRISNFIINYVYINDSELNSNNSIDELKQRVFLYLSDKSEKNYQSIINVCRDDVCHNSDYFDIEEAKKLISDIVKVSEISDISILSSIVNSKFSSAFNNQINNINNQVESELVISIKKSVSRIVFKNNLCTEINLPIRIVNSSFFIDNPNTLNNLTNNNIRAKSQNNFVFRLFRDNLFSSFSDEGQPDFISKIIANDKLNEIYHLLENTGIGSIEKQENGHYIYNSKNLSQPLEILNLSMGLKSFVLLKSLLQENAIKEKDILIFDEPEIHLHPAWQIIYAQLLVLLQVTFDLTLVITSHSPYFIDAINLYAAKYDALKNCNFYLSEMEDNQVTFKNVTNNIDKIYEKLADPFDTLDTLRYELQEEGKLC
ncbi:MAG: AAA family ATPase [Clostridia bacterium]|nr:AAA family ATPase [Clostridia bacterium]